MQTRRFFLHSAAASGAAGVGFALPRLWSPPGLRGALALEPGDTRVVLFQLADCPELRTRLLAQGHDGTVGRLVGSERLDGGAVDEVLARADLPIPVALVSEARVARCLQVIGHSRTPLVLRFDSGGRLLAASQSLPAKQDECS